MGVKNCSCLADCDKYFEDLLALSEKKKLLGYIELDSEDLEHMASLISKEIQKPYFDLSESLTISLFLVWIGILYYQEGDFWSNVYNMLKLPSEQQQMQTRLSKIFLQTVKKYKLPNFKGKLRYIMPILAHGYIPNFYLRDYFLNVVFRIYKERQELGLSVNLEETKHIVSNWRKEYAFYIEKENKLKKVEEEEKELLLALDVLRNEDKLKRLIELKRGIKKSSELKELLSKPEDWLEEVKAEREKFRQQLEEFREILERKEIFTREYDEVESKIKKMACFVLSYWNNRFIPFVLELSIDEIEELFKVYTNLKKKFSGLLGLLLRLIMPSQYHQMLESKRKLEEKFIELPLKKNLLENLTIEMVTSLKELQELLKKRQNLIEEAEKEAAATSYVTDISQDALVDLEKSLKYIDREINSYEENLKILGKGNLEEGSKELKKQRGLRQKIERIKREITSQYTIDTLLENLSLRWKYMNEEEIDKRLSKIQRKKDEYLEKFKEVSNPLYSLNESTRVFIFQGEELAEEFIFQSLLLIQRLDQGEGDFEDIYLPKRIKEEMRKWWEEEGKEKLSIERERSKWKREKDSLFLRKPFVKLDTIERVIKVELPRQILKKPEKAVFVIGGDKAIAKEIEVPIRKIGDEYQTEPVFGILEIPMEAYHFELWQSDEVYNWEIKDIWHNKCLLFSAEGKLIEDLYLLEDGAYIVTTYGSKVNPSIAVKERGRLIGEWSNYEYVYVDLSDIDMILVEIEGEKFVFKKPIDLKPQLVGEEVIEEVKANGKAVYNKKLPSLIFSLGSMEEIDFYGVRLDFSGGSFFKPLSDFKEAIKEGNVVFIPLYSLVSDVYGSCKMALIYKQNIIWVEEFTVVPDLKIEFDKLLYSPFEKRKSELGKVKLHSRYPFKIIGNEVVESSLFKNVIKFDPTNDQVNVELMYFLKEGSQQVNVDLSIVVPKVYWRLNEIEDWKSEIEEIWFEDMGDVQVKVPSFLQNSKVKLTLSPNGHTIVPNNKKGVLIFNLCQLSDIVYSIREEGNLLVQDLVISFEDKNISSSFLLVRIRLHWEVANVEVKQRRENGKRILSIKWEDLGKASDRIVRLWPLSDVAVEIIERQIPEEESILEFIEDVERLPLGKYRMQFDIEDPWVEEEISLPGENERNCVDIVIGDKEEVLQEIKQKGLDIVGFEVEGKRISVGKNYWIQDIEVCSDFPEGVEFEGNICTLDEKGEVAYLEYNPAHLYFGVQPKYFNKLPYLIDRDNDGFMYCQRCKVIFSETEGHKECGDEVILPEYIFVQIRRGEK
ncbi:conserved hypothetical protein [Thermoanaerobacterium thermosaccharolyticum DSM 571]|uniref:Uncharacterized protein n=1 Tax=Thermoanaerobacterium thermosaccharolyticum (strain ATCC 7956 / DSM 571 / NCIMB 9385 / NCA 3814 / NCTC 13789 / WDCM 00135 / 2032) TaxID=580327 RepID=D9TMH9_THETC|nr:hypothetical protein [Thermoanaerobacterium thermosaccharolyticum]ADL68467.1 conserved hypothetical protein [Thermoanaerobacterium thermosaccharolyticum DSM 571]MCP2239467.1 hypothetical protein [Thermoanaerobacterium thermosaccharolyticum]